MTKLVALHPLPLDGSIWPEDLEFSVDDFVAPTLYSAGDDVGAWARSALDAAGSGPLVLVGSSVGGSVALEVARLAPDRVQCLILCGTKAGHRPEPALRDDALEMLADGGIDAAWERHWRPLFGPDARDAAVDRGRQIAARVGATAVAAGVRAFHGRPDRTAFVTSWAGPVWFARGAHDGDVISARQFAESLSNARFRSIPGVGHYLSLEAPEALTAVLHEALDELARR